VKGKDVKLSLCLIKHYAMKTYGEMDVQIHVFLISVLIGSQHSFMPGGFTLVKEPPGIHRIEGWVGPRAGLDNMDKLKFLTLPGLELQPLGHPAVASVYTG
jgi:hypothetical protein